MLSRIVTLLLFFGLSTVSAQEWEFSLLGGTSGYMGDLNPENPLAFNDWAAGASVKYNLNHTWGIRGNFAYANLFAYDGNSKVQQRVERNLGFFGSVKEAAVLVDFNFFKWLPQRGRIVYTPYIFAGVGGISFDPKWYLPYTVGETPEKVKLRDMQTEYHDVDNHVPYAKYTFSIPFGAGFKYNLRGPWSIGLEVGYRLALTDYLDDVSGNYPTQSPPRLPPGVELTDWQYLAYRKPSTATPPVGQRGDGRPYDSYMIAGFTLSYTIFKGGCPEWQ